MKFHFEQSSLESVLERMVYLRDRIAHPDHIFLASPGDIAVVGMRLYLPADSVNLVEFYKHVP